MRIFKKARITGTQIRPFPGKSKLASYIWKQGVPYNHVQDTIPLNASTFLDTSLRKWEIDESWNKQKQSVMWLRAGFERGDGKEIAVNLGYDEIPNHAVDRRALARSVLWFLRYIEGRVLIGRLNYNVEEFSTEYAPLLTQRYSPAAPNE